MKDVYSFAKNVDKAKSKTLTPNNRSYISEDEKLICFTINEELQKIDMDSRERSLTVLNHRTHLPDCLTLCCKSDEEEYLMKRLDYSEIEKVYGCCRFVTRNLKLNAAITTVFLGAMILVGYYAFPDPAPILNMNISNFAIENDIGICDDNCRQACLPWGIVWGSNLNYPNGGPAYVYEVPEPQAPCGSSDSRYASGNLTDCITYVAHRCGCNYTQWYNYALSLINGTPSNPTRSICLPNPDNISSCCGQVWTNTNFQNRTCAPEADICINMVRITKRCLIDQAMDQARSFVSTQRGLYYGFGIPLALTLVWFMLIDYFYCAG